MVYRNIVCCPFCETPVHFDTRDSDVIHTNASYLCDPDDDGCRLDPQVWHCGHPNAFYSSGVWRVSEDRKPHTAMKVYDAARGIIRTLSIETPTIIDSRTLSSEVLAAIAILRYRLRHKLFVDHHTIPVCAHTFPSCRHAFIFPHRSCQQRLTKVYIFNTR